jgi:hypothetical protein
MSVVHAQQTAPSTEATPALRGDKHYVQDATITPRMLHADVLALVSGEAAPHDHDGTYATSGHTHSTAHDHDAAYAATAHVHDTTHQHDAAYSTVAHTHASYAATVHAHDAAYAALAHVHAPVHTPLGNDTLALALATNTSVRLTVTANRTLTTTVPAAGSTRVVLILTSGASSFTVTFGSGFKPVGTLATGATTARVFALSFISDGTNLYETGRTAAMVA